MTVATLTENWEKMFICLSTGYSLTNIWQL